MDALTLRANSPGRMSWLLICREKNTSSCAFALKECAPTRMFPFLSIRGKMENTRKHVQTEILTIWPQRGKNLDIISFFTPHLTIDILYKICLWLFFWFTVDLIYSWKFYSALSYTKQQYEPFTFFTLIFLLCLIKSTSGFRALLAL